MAITTAMATTFKKELLSGGHCFFPAAAITVTAASSATALTSVSSVAGVAVGMPVTGTGIDVSTVGTFIAAVGPTNTLTLTRPTTAIISAAAISVAGDVFKMALIKTPVVGTWDSTAASYGTGAGTGSAASVTNMGTDEVTNSAGTGYVAGGFTLTNVAPSTGGTVAFISFAPNPSWTTASFSTAGCMIYNSSTRLATQNRACSVHDFGGPQQVSTGTFTVLMPTNDSANSILRIASYVLAAVVSASSLFLPMLT